MTLGFMLFTQVICHCRHDLNLSAGFTAPGAAPSQRLTSGGRSEPMPVGAPGRTPSPYTCRFTPVG